MRKIENLKRKSREICARLNRALSAHEIAALLLLSYAPVDVIASSPDYLELQQAGLVSLVGSQFALTESGADLLRRLSRE